jgi:uncharacterized membrane protein YqiK
MYTHLKYIEAHKYKYFIKMGAYFRGGGVGPPLVRGGGARVVPTFQSALRNLIKN